MSMQAFQVLKQRCVWGGGGGEGVMPVPERHVNEPVVSGGGLMFRSLYIN